MERSEFEGYSAGVRYMADTEDIISVHNLQVEYTKLTNDIPKKSAELSLIYKDIEKAKSELLSIQQKKKEEEHNLEDITNRLHEQRNISRTQESVAKEEISILTKEHDELVLKIRQSTKELSRLNNQVLSAQDEYIELQRDLQKVQAILISDTDTRNELTNQISFLDVTKEVLEKEISTKTSELNTKLKEGREELSKLVYLANQKREEAEQAQYRVKMYTDELYVHMNDYQVIKTRLENVWKTTFPELELPL